MLFCLRLAIKVVKHYPFLMSKSIKTQFFMITTIFCICLLQLENLPNACTFHISDFFKKRSLFWSENFKKFVSGFFTLYAFIISKVIIRTQNYTNASLISAPVVISYQNVRGA